MRAISLWQPYASAIALLLKRIETRSWSTDYRGPLAIHAARRFGGAEKRFAQVERGLGRMPARIPLGAVIAVVDLVDVRPTIELALEISPIEKMYGNYSSGRFGWMLNNVRALKEPIPCLGRQRWFDVPDALIGDALQETEPTRCPQHLCFAPDVGCALGEMELSRCPHWNAHVMRSPA